jgi:hypothetical protein
VSFVLKKCRFGMPLKNVEPHLHTIPNVLPSVSLVSKVVKKIIAFRPPPPKNQFFIFPHFCSWVNDPVNVSVAYRGYNTPDQRGLVVGFHLARQQ